MIEKRNKAAIAGLNYTFIEHRMVSKGVSLLLFMLDKALVLSNNRLRSGLLFIALHVWVTTGFASDLNRELNYRRIMQDHNHRELISLDAGDRKFAGLYTQALKNPDARAVLILHEMGAYPDQQAVIQGLRKQLPEHQWACLSLQMPVREPGATRDDYYALFPDAALRIQAGIDFLTKQAFKHIAIVGYGLGGLMAIYAAAEKSLTITALAAISLAVPATDHPSAQTLAMLKKIQVPLLDVYAELDAEDVVTSARDRRVAAKNNAAYRQLRIEAEDHNFQNGNGILAKRIYSWLTRLVSSTDPQ